jgi:Zn-finger nucleic acid-binding protein
LGKVISMTNCPMCENAVLLRSTFDGDLPINECESCGGTWLRANEYAVWLRTQEIGFDGVLKAAGLRLTHQIKDSNQAAVCPDCGHFLRPYQVGSKVDFHLDRCSHCNGVWFDKHELDVLKAAGLGDEINLIFTKPWQEKVQDEIAADRLAEMYLERFGTDDYERIKGIREWLGHHPNRNTLLAYLLDEDPYAA